MSQTAYIAFPPGKEPVFITDQVPNEVCVEGAYIYSPRSQNWWIWKLRPAVTWYDVNAADVPAEHRAWVLLL